MLNYISDEPEVTPSGLLSPVGADFCLTADSSSPILELRCDLMLEDTFTVPTPERTWYKDGVLVYRTVDGAVPTISDDFYQTGNNSLLLLGVINPPPLTVLADGSLLLDWRAENISFPTALPEGVTADSFRSDVFKTLLGSWMCQLNNSLGGGVAETVLTDCGKYNLI